MEDRAGSKKGSAGLANTGAQEVRRRERVEELQAESLKNDPYVHRRGTTLVCQICSMTFPTDSAYMAHNQARKHQINIAKRKEKQQQEQLKPSNPRTVTIGIPEHKIIKVRDPHSQALGIMLKVSYPEIVKDVKPQFRFMSAYEQKIEKPSNKHQYLVLAAEPYNTIAIRLMPQPIDQNTLQSYFDSESGDFKLQFLWPAKASNTLIT